MDKQIERGRLIEMLVKDNAELLKQEEEKESLTKAVAYVMQTNQDRNLIYRDQQVDLANIFTKQQFLLAEIYQDTLLMEECGKLDPDTAEVVSSLDKEHTTLKGKCDQISLNYTKYMEAAAQK